MKRIFRPLYFWADLARGVAYKIGRLGDRIMFIDWSDLGDDDA